MNTTLKSTLFGLREVVVLDHVQGGLITAQGKVTKVVLVKIPVLF